MKTQTRVLGMLLAAGLAATPAVAIPPALDRVPAEAPIVIGIRDLNHLFTSVERWTGVFAPEEEMEELAMVEDILGTPGVNADGSAAVVLNFVPGAEEPIPVIIVPVSDYEAFVEAMNGQAGDGVSTLEIEGEEAYARNLGGGFVALGPDFDAVSDFQGESGRLAAHEARLGKNAAAAADDADLFVIVDLQAMRPFLEMGMQQMEQSMAMAGMMGGEAVQAQMEMMMGAARAVVDEGRTAFIGMGSGEDGLWLDFAGQFAEGSDTAGVFAEGGNAGALLNKLPPIDYIAAFAIDTSSEGIRGLMGQMAELNQGMGFGIDVGQMAELVNGQATVIGVTPGLFAGGLFANTVQFTATARPQELLEKSAEMIREMDGQTQQGLKFSTSFEKDAAKAGDTPLHAYGVTMEVDPNDENAMMASMAMQQMAMIFGAEAGPKGFIALTDNGMYQTMSRNTTLMSKALDSGGGLDSKAGIEAVSKRLPDNRTGVAYVNVKGVTDMVAPMLAMMGGVDLGEIPEDLSPIAMSLSTGGGGMHSRVFMPADVLQLFSDLRTRFQGDDEWEEIEEEPASKPRF